MASDVAVHDSAMPIKPPEMINSSAPCAALYVIGLGIMAAPATIVMRRP